MGVAQLYYTSCEHGLAGYAGYQFNAATPGVDAHVLREVERFTVYEPPRSASPDRVDEHPVNLCYAPDVGGRAVLSRVVSSGADPSGRPGNYFAHSLVATAAVDDDPLPAELWGAGFWTATPVTDPDLPVLDLPPGPLDRERSDAWVRRWPSALVARLLAAADAAIDGGPPLVLVADSASVAHWVAALTHLLPPARARDLSFATYAADPHDTFVHVIGVPMDSDTASLRGRFTVCDPSADPPDDLPEPAPETAALADRLADLGPRKALGLWRAAEVHSSGREASLAQWRPVVAAAAVLDGDGSPEVDLPAVRAWLSRAVGWLPP
ncbi:GAP1-N2 domain-containing protein, partial [Nocardiopsis lucentensis]